MFIAIPLFPDLHLALIDIFHPHLQINLDEI